MKEGGGEEGEGREGGGRGWEGGQIMPLSGGDGNVEYINRACHNTRCL